MEHLNDSEQRYGGNLWKRELVTFSWSLYERYRVLKSKIVGTGKIYSGQYMEEFDLSATQGGRRTAGGTVVLVDKTPLDRRMHLTQDNGVANRVDSLSILADSNPDVPVDLLQAWESSSGHIYKRDSKDGNEDLALNVLDDAVGEQEACDSYQTFAEQIISSLPNRWVISESEIQKWISSISSRENVERGSIG